MTGFSDYAIIVGPHPESFESAERDTRFNIRDTMQVILNYCRYEMIDLYGLFSDEIVQDVLPEIPKFSNLSKGDAFLATKYNDVFRGYKLNTLDNRYQVIVNKYVKKYPVDKDADLETRFECLTKRERAASDEILSLCPLVFTIQFKDHRLFHAKSKENDGRLVVDINANTSMAECTMSGVKMNTSAIFSNADASLPVYRWEGYFQ